MNEFKRYRKKDRKDERTMKTERSRRKQVSCDYLLVKKTRQHFSRPGRDRFRAPVVEFGFNEYLEL